MGRYTSIDLWLIMLTPALRSFVSNERAANLLNSQGTNLDVLTVRLVYRTSTLSRQSLMLTQVISTVPPDWPLPSLSSFLTRSFRRITHQKREGELTKSIAAGQNLEVKDLTYEPIREAGALLEEELQLEADSETGEYDEKKATIPAEIFEIVPPNGATPDLHNSLLFSEKGPTASGVGVDADDASGDLR